MLEDTSFAIHPGKEKDTNTTPYKRIGTLQAYKEAKDTYLFECTKGHVAIKFYTDSIVRIVMNPFSQPKLDASKAVVAEGNSVEVKVKDQDQAVSLLSKHLIVTIEKETFSILIQDDKGHVLLDEGNRGMGFKPTGEVITYKKMDKDDHFYGFGEKTGFLDKRGERYEMWNSDVYIPHNPETDPLYVSIPYFMTLRNGRSHGVFFDNTFRTIFDMKSELDYYSFEAEGGQLDYYVMAGPEPKQVLEQYTYLTGRMPLPPKWSLGYHQSRYSYETEAEVREIAQNFIDRDIPLDVLYLDIHYMNGYRVFTFDEERFPDPKKLIQDLKQMGIRIVPIVDPGVKKDPEYYVYQEGINQDQFCKYIEGNIYHGEVWPGISAFPDFTDEKARKWWGDKHQFYTDLGIEGIWNDMNEPAVFNETKTMDVEVMHRNDGEPTTHRELHNVYGFLMGKATYEGLKHQLNGKRPFLLTRAAFSGVQRYAAVWTGDNRSFWEHLQMTLPMVMNLGLSGVPLVGPDVGGFAHDTNGELLVRWTQVGAFTPYFRNHSAIGTLYQEPWRFGEENESIMRKYIQMRYKWMPHLYKVFQEATKKGLPVMRPLFMEFPKDEKTYNINDQFMIGDNVLIAPILAPSVTDRAVYFPEGDWIEMETGNVYAGEQVHLVHAELDYMPIFVKRGTAIFQGEIQSRQNKSPKQVEMHIFASPEEHWYEATYYDDDGETFAYENGEYLELKLKVVHSTETITITTLEHNGDYKPDYVEIPIVIHHLSKHQTVIMNGEEINGRAVLTL
ncbi:glycoside hydrolase family 31 protein [Salirhabdus sp. Marseille-P4669]|uniref:glycoside hydrolase family 31 protein n=1 Tax=Salirhabdus sp. Marseille-P4669 TaxID=2042310 RepID=UPI000C7A3090|nr:glycoside hydrolase family 31 protein [Salirhabdus sp. Marseille-P4669]